jgi:hypothetical protein
MYDRLDVLHPKIVKLYIFFMYYLGLYLSRGVRKSSPKTIIVERGSSYKVEKRNAAGPKS